MLRFRSAIGDRSSHRSNRLFVSIRTIASPSKRPGRRLRSGRSGRRRSIGRRFVSCDGRDGTSRRLQRSLPIIRSESVPESRNGQHDGLLFIFGQLNFNLFIFYHSHLKNDEHHDDGYHQRSHTISVRST